MSMLPRKVESTVARTKQEFRQEVDINRIVARARQGQAVTHVARGVPTYADVSDVGDYKGALDKLREMDLFFSRLPSAVRKAFNNDPAQFLDGMETVEGRKVMADAGLIAQPRGISVEDPAGVPRRGPDGRFIEDEPPPGGED